MIIKEVITENLINPPVAITAGITVTAANAFIGALPVIINILMVIYLITLIVNGSWKFYKEMKARKLFENPYDESSK